MADYRAPINGQAFITYLSLVSQADTKIMQANPTLAAGDVISNQDGVSGGNLATLPTVTPAAGKAVKISLSAGEATADNTTVIFSDVAGAEWCDQTLNIAFGARSIDNLAFPATSGRAILVNSDTTVQADVRELLGTAWLTPGVAGTPDVNTKTLTTGAITGAAVAAGAIVQAVNPAADLGDYAVGDTLDFTFSTDGTLGGTPAVSVYKTNSLTQVTTGVTLDVDYDGVTGLNHVRIALGSDGTFYAANCDFMVVITTGTVGGISVAGVTIATFSLQKKTIKQIGGGGGGGTATADVNVVSINQVAATSVTTVAANQGTTQPVNFTGTAGAALVKGDAVDIAGAAVNSAAAQIGANVVTYASGQAPLQPTTAGRTLDVATTGEAGLDFSNVKDGNLDETKVGGTFLAAFNAARAQGLSKWALTGTELTLYRSDGTTPLITFDLDSATSPTERVPQ